MFFNYYAFQTIIRTIHETLRDEEALFAQKFLVVTNFGNKVDAAEIANKQELESFLIKLSCGVWVPAHKVYEITKEVSYTFNITPAKCELKLS